MIISRKMRCTQHVKCTGEKRNIYGVLVCKHEGRRLLVRPRHRWKDNIKMTLQRQDGTSFLCLKIRACSRLL
jgi:hypothetical protein